MRYIYITLRILLGFLFIFSGYVKLIDPWGASIKFTEYLDAMGMEVFRGIAFYLANLLSILEFFTGYLLVFHLRMKWASRLSMLLMLFFTPITLWLAVTHKVTDCGCFGDAIKLTDWQTFWKNIILLIPTFIVFFSWRKYPSKIFSAKQRLLSIIGLLFSIGTCYYSYQHLPIIDFRPYAVGKSITKGMEIPENAPIDEYTTVLKYKKDGKIKEFTQDNYPWQDSTWHFVDSKQQLIKKGYTPPITDFFIVNEEHNDITTDILNIEKCLLIVSYKLEKTNFAQDFREMKIASLIEKASINGIKSYILTSSSTQQIENMKAFLHPNIPFISADEKVLEAMIRANPGIVLLSEGIIKAKWNCNDTPQDIEIINKLYNTNTDNIKLESNRKAFYTILFLFLSLFIITLTILKIRKK